MVLPRSSSYCLRISSEVGWLDYGLCKNFTYTVLINGQAHSLVVPQRGLRQRDPLSPFIFVLCTEGLTHLLNKAEREGCINGIQLSQQGPSIHHLLFANDSLFLCKGSRRSSYKSYGGVIGQVINLYKSSITFGNNVEQETRVKTHDILGIYNEGGAWTYLGLLECFSGSKVYMLDSIQDKMKTRLLGLYARCMSLAGK